MRAGISAAAQWAPPAAVTPAAAVAATVRVGTAWAGKPAVKAGGGAMSLLHPMIHMQCPEPHTGETTGEEESSTGTGTEMRAEREGMALPLHLVHMTGRGRGIGAGGSMSMTGVAGQTAGTQEGVAMKTVRGAERKGGAGSSRKGSAGVAAGAAAAALVGSLAMGEVVVGGASGMTHPDMTRRDSLRPSIAFIHVTED